MDSRGSDIKNFIPEGELLATEAKQDDIISAIQSGGSTLPTGAATSANQTTEIGHLSEIEGAVETLETALNTPTAGGSGQTTVATAGTAVALASSTACRAVTIKALSTNTGLMYVSIDPSDADNTDFELSASEAITIPIDNLDRIRIDASVNGEKVSYIYVV